MDSFLLWWSIVSTVVAVATTFGGVLLLISSIKQNARADSEKDRKKDQVKIWMQDAFGISQGLVKIVQDNFDKRYTSTNDMANAIWALQSCALALYQSLYEERCVTEEEYKQLQIEIRAQIKEQQAEAREQQKKMQASVSPSASKPIEKK